MSQFDFFPLGDSRNEHPSLRDEQIDTIYREVWSSLPIAGRLLRFARAIESALAADRAATAVNPTMTRDELVAAAESIGMRFTAPDRAANSLAVGAGAVDAAPEPNVRFPTDAGSS